MIIRHRRTGPGFRYGRRLAGYGGAVVVALFVGQVVSTSSWARDETRAADIQLAPPGLEARQNRFETLMTANRIPPGALIEPTAKVDELRVTLVSGSPTGPPERLGALPQPSLQLTGRRQRAGAVVVERGHTMTGSDLLVVALDRRGQARWSETIADPTVLRAEFADADGRLSGQVLEHPSVEVVLTIPHHPAITEVRVYRPRPGGDVSVLHLLGSLSLD